MEHVTKNGKRIEWIIEAHRHFDDLHHGIIILRVLLDNVRETTIKKDGRRIRINNGDIYVNIDGFLQTHIHGSFFQVKPIYYFIRALIDKYIYHFLEKYDGLISSDCHELFKRIRSFFNLQLYKYE